MIISLALLILACTLTWSTVSITVITILQTKKPSSPSMDPQTWLKIEKDSLYNILRSSFITALIFTSILVWKRIKGQKQERRSQTDLDSCCIPLLPAAMTQFL